MTCLEVINDMSYDVEVLHLITQNINDMSYDVWQNINDMSYDVWYVMWRRNSTSYYTSFGIIIW